MLHYFNCVQGLFRDTGKHCTSDGGGHADTLEVYQETAPRDRRVMLVNLKQRRCCACRAVIGRKGGTSPNVSRFGDDDMPAAVEHSIHEHEAKTTIETREDVGSNHLTVGRGSQVSCQ